MAEVGGGGASAPRVSRLRVWGSRRSPFSLNPETRASARLGLAGPGGSPSDVPLSARSRAEPQDPPTGADAQRGHRCEQPGPAREIPQLRPLPAPGRAGGAGPALVADLPRVLRGGVRCGATGARAPPASPPSIGERARSTRIFRTCWSPCLENSLRHYWTSDISTKILSWPVPVSGLLE